MPLANHYDMVEAFPSNRANHPLGVRVLPWRARRDNRFANVQCLGLTRKSSTIDLVSVPDEIPGRFFQVTCLEQLARSIPRSDARPR
jgi:hypothetical protein